MEEERREETGSVRDKQGVDKALERGNKNKERRSNERLEKERRKGSTEWGGGKEGGV